MGHSNDDTMNYYVTGIQDLDTQAIIRGKPQRLGLVDASISMMSRRNLLAPQPPGTQLIDQPPRMAKVEDIESFPGNEDIAVLTVANLTQDEQYSSRRQSRNKAYRKQREDFFEGHQNIVKSLTPANPLRLPSRYLESLFKFEPNRRKVVDLLYPHGVIHAKDALSLGQILEPMVEMANPKKRRYGYNSVEMTEDKRCGVCNQQLYA
jgi:hypothetical protein